MEFKGTKGKWYLKGRTNLSVHCISVENGIELVYPVAKIDDFDKSSRQKKANALLIAKAPEMLEMLNRFMEITRELNHPRLDHLRGSANKLIKDATEIN